MTLKEAVVNLILAYVSMCGDVCDKDISALPIISCVTCDYKDKGRDEGRCFAEKLADKLIPLVQSSTFLDEIGFDILACEAVLYAAAKNTRVITCGTFLKMDTQEKIEFVEAIVKMKEFIERVKENACGD